MKASCRTLPVDLRHTAAEKTQSRTARTRFMLLLFLLGVFTTLARLGFAQAQNPPLNLANNFFVTGDYVVAGANGMTTNFTTINGTSYAVGTIKVPDTNPGITGTKQVPKGAQIIAALLYWQTVEKVGVAPGAPGSGQNGYFRPLIAGGPAAPGYAISGTSLGGNNTVSWSSGGCTGGSTGKLLRTYRADVAGGLPVDANGNSIVNGTAANGNAITGFEVRIPSVGSSAPLTLGATLVVIYRIPSGPNGPGAPLNAIVIYDGDFAAGATQLTMTQQMQIYDADPNGQNAVTRLTHIVGNGKSNKFQSVYLGGNVASTLLPSLYGKNLPPFPGWYGTWDNPTWTFSSPNTPPLTEDATLATTMVSPAASQQGCVSWGAIIMSTKLKNSDGDGIADLWKTNQGYCDYLTNPSCTGSGQVGWIPLMGAAKGQKDIFLQYDYMCSTVTGQNTCAASSIEAPLSAASPGPAAGTTTYTGTFSPTIPTGTLVTIGGFTNAGNNGQFFVVSGTSAQLVVSNPNAVAETNPGNATYGDYSFDPRLAVDPVDNLNAVDKVVDAFTNQKSGAKFVLHAELGNAILESQSTCADTDVDGSGNLTCTFPNEPGTVGFREGLAYIKNQTIDNTTGILGCDPNSDANCGAVFHHGKKDTYHYVLFSHGVGIPNWFLSDKSVQSVTQSGSTVTFTTLSPHNLTPIAGDSACSKANGYIGRVTVINAITNPNLNGTFCAKAAGNPNKFAITVKALLPGKVLPSYTIGTDPNLAVANGQVTSMSGYSEVGGQNSVIALGEGGWGPAQNLSPPSEGNKWNVKGGTFMHEVGHTLGLTHGGTFYNNLPNDYTPNYEANCKPNVQTIMSYLFQFDLLQQPGALNLAPVKVLDYSEDPPAADTDAIPTLTENSPQAAGILDSLTYPYTSWFELGGTLPSNHCDGTPTATGEKSYIYTNQPIADFFWTAATGEDINFNGSTADVMHSHNEWEGTPAANGAGSSPGVDLQQVSAAGTVSTIGPGGEAGGFKPAGGGGGFKPAGGGGGLQPAGGGGGFKPAGGGGGFKPAGGGGASAEITHDQASSYPRPPQNLFIQQEEASPRLIDLDWFAASFGTAVQYNIYRSTAGGPFTNVGHVLGSVTMFQDTVTCNLGGYQYQVTAVTVSDSGTQSESSPSNTVPAPGEPLLTGCYTVSNFTVPASSVQGTTGLQISWTLADDEYETPPAPWSSATTGNAVTRSAANTLVAIGPLPGNCTSSGRTTLVADGVATNQFTSPDAPGPDTFTNNGTNNFTFTWNNSDAFCAGTYAFELDLDHVNNSPAQTQAGPNSLVFGIDINDQDKPHITTPALPSGTVAVPYTDTLTEDGGTAPFNWTVTGLPAGISQQPAGSATFSGTACVANTYAVNATVTDAKSNSGAQAFSLQLAKGSTTTSVVSSFNPSVFQQMVTFTVSVASAPASSCVPGGTVTLLDGGVPIASGLLLSGGTTTFTTSALSVATHSITASYGGDSNFTGSSSGVYSQIVNPALTQTAFNSRSPSPAFVGQPITISWTFSVVAPGQGSPIPPSGSISVTATDSNNNNYACTTAAVQGAGMCTLVPAAAAAGNVTFTIAYPGDGNFVASGDNGNFNVYKLVFTAQPTPTGVGLAINAGNAPPGVAVTAEDSGGNPLTTFGGPITLAIAKGPGTLSGTNPQTAVNGVATFGNLSINQIANGDTLKASPDGVVFDATSNAFNIDTFYVDSQGDFGTLDLPTGTATQIAAATVPGSNGIDLTPGGVSVYAYNASNQLMSIAPSTGVATQVPNASAGTTGSIPNQATTGALTNGSYFGIDSATGILYTINTTTGATTQVGANPTLVALVPAGCSFEASLTGSATALYYTVGSTASGTNCTATAFTDTLYQIDPTSGATTLIGPVTVNGAGVNEFVGSAFVGGTLYGFTSGGQIYNIDPASGKAMAPVNTTPTTSIISAGSSQ